MYSKNVYLLLYYKSCTAACYIVNITMLANGVRHVGACRAKIIIITSIFFNLLRSTRKQFLFFVAEVSIGSLRIDVYFLNCLLLMSTSALKHFGRRCVFRISLRWNCII